SFAHLSKVIVVPHHECESMRETSKVIEEFALRLLHTFDASKSFAVRLAAIGDESMCRQRVCAICCDLTRMVRTHFNYCDLSIRFDAKYGQRNSDVIVQIPFSCRCAKR